MVGVSRSQVSTAFTGNGRISVATRERILRHAREVGYVPNANAQRLAAGRSPKLIGIFARNLDLGVGTVKVKKVQTELAQMGFDVPLYSWEMPDRAELVGDMSLIGKLCRERPRAIICKWGNLLPEEQAALHKFIDTGGIVVTYGYPSDLGCDQVIIDEVTATFVATKHLIEFGHRLIGFSHHGKSENHYRGFERALREAGITVRSEWVFHSGIYEQGGGDLAAAYMELAEKPTALCLCNDVSASAFVNELHRAGMRVPDDVSVVGHDDVPAARYCAVPLTTVSEPVDEISREIVEMVTSRLERRYDGEGRVATFVGSLVARESVAPPAVTQLSERRIKQVANRQQGAAFEQFAKTLRQAPRRASQPHLHENEKFVREE